MTSSAAPGDKRLERGNAKRQAILQRAVDLASVEGLETLSIGRLATELGISKSGAILHFGTKQELQLATIAAARERFAGHVVEPAQSSPPGLARLWALTLNWIAYVENRVFPGGCFFSTVAAEFHSRPGPVRDAIAATHADWVLLLHHHIARAIVDGQIDADTDPNQIVYELDAVTRHAHVMHRLHEDPEACDRSRVAARAILDRAATAETGELLALPLPERTRSVTTTDAHITRIGTHADPDSHVVISLRGAKPPRGPNPPTTDLEQAT
ncbi:TetR/AcrR family transcriptional regulator [Stackebrandtia soli]|uniref:TetR/AcrR family transcriptional regulator n=1 Tax=Stackebrandtia soli TaxID=1892856 RepID=UPI0039ECC52B